MPIVHLCCVLYSVYLVATCKAGTRLCPNVLVTSYVSIQYLYQIYELTDCYSSSFRCQPVPALLGTVPECFSQTPLRPPRSTNYSLVEFQEAPALLQDP